MNAPLLPSLVFAGLVLGLSTATAQTPIEGEERVTRTAEGPVADHRADELRDPTSFELDRRDPAEITVKARVGASSKGLSELRTFGDSWVYEATTDLFM